MEDAEDVLVEVEHKVVGEEVGDYDGVNVVGGDCIDRHYMFDSWLKNINFAKD